VNGEWHIMRCGAATFVGLATDDEGWYDPLYELTTATLVDPQTKRIAEVEGIRALGGLGSWRKAHVGNVTTCCDLDDLDAADRDKVMRMIDNLTKQLRAARSNILLAPVNGGH